MEYRQGTAATMCQQLEGTVHRQRLLLLSVTYACGPATPSTSARHLSQPSRQAWHAAPPCSHAHSAWLLVPPRSTLYQLLRVVQKSHHAGVELCPVKLGFRDIALQVGEVHGHTHGVEPWQEKQQQQ